VVAVTKKNTNAALVYSFLYKLVEVSEFYIYKHDNASIKPCTAQSFCLCKQSLTLILCIHCVVKVILFWPFVCRCSLNISSHWKKRAFETISWQCMS